RDRARPCGRQRQPLQRRGVRVRKAALSGPEGAAHARAPARRVRQSATRPDPPLRARSPRCFELRHGRGAGGRRERILEPGFARQVLELPPARPRDRDRRLSPGPPKPSSVPSLPPTRPHAPARTHALALPRRSGPVPTPARSPGPGRMAGSSPRTVNPSFTIAAHGGFRSMVHAILGIRAPLYPPPAGTATVAWTTERDVNRKKVNLWSIS